MSVLAYRLQRFLRVHWATALALTAVVAIVGSVLLFLTAGAIRTAGAADRYEAWRGAPYDALVEQPRGRPRTEQLAALPAVATVDTATFVFGALQTPDGEYVDSLVFAGSQDAFGTYLTEGVEPNPGVPGEFPAEFRGEFIASQSFADSTGAELGDRFQLVTLTEEQARQSGFDNPNPGGPTITATVVGIITGTADIQDDYAIALFPPTLLDQGDIGISASQSTVRLTPGSTLDDLRRQLDAMADGSSFGVTGAVPWTPEPVRKAAETRARGAIIVAVVGAVAALAVVGQILIRQVRLADTEAAPLQAMGMTPFQLVADSGARVSLPVAAGSVLAGLVAFLISGWFPLGFVGRLEPVPGLRFEPLAHLVAPVLFASALLGWVIVALLRDARHEPPPAIPALVDGLASRTRPAPASTAIRFALTRQARDRGSVKGPLIGFGAVLAMLIVSITFGAGLDRMVDQPERYGSFSLGIGQGGAEAVPKSVQATLEADPDVSAFVLAGHTIVSVGSEALDVTGLLPVKGDLSPTVMGGRLPTGDDEIALGRVTASESGVGVGDELAVVGPSGQRSLRVTGIAVIPGVEGGDGMGLGGLVTFAGLQRLEPGALPTAGGLALRADAPPDTVARLSGATGMAIGPPSPPSEIVNLGRVRAVPYAVAATLGVLAMLSLAHQLLVSARQRRRDVAVLAALGADRRWVTKVVHWQATIFVVVVTPIAVALGLLVGSVLFRAFIDRIGGENTPKIPVLTLALLLAAVLFLANAVAVLPAHRARHALPAGPLSSE